MQRAVDDARIAELYLRGWTQAAIGREFNVTQQAISKRVMIIIEEWRDAAIHDISLLKAGELEKLSVLEGQYWDAWEKSQRDFKETTKTTGIDLIGDAINKKIVKERKVAGEAVYLEGIRKCIELRCKILGVQEADKLDLNLKTDQPIAVVKMNMDAL